MVRLLVVPSGAHVAIVRSSACPAELEQKRRSSMSAILKSEKQKQKERLGMLVLLSAGQSEVS